MKEILALHEKSKTDIDYEKILSNENFVKEAMETCDSDDFESKIEDIYVLSVSLLNAYIQENYTGPSLNINSSVMMSNIGYQDLSIDGEEAYHLVRRPAYLVLAIRYFQKIKDHHYVYRWLYIYSRFLQQRLLDNFSNSLYEELTKQIELLSVEIEGNVPSRIICRFNLMFGVINHYYEKDRKAKEHFEQAQKGSKFEWKLTGSLGKRTKFQTFEVSQLVVAAKSHGHETEEKKETPRNLNLNDDVLLEKLALSTNDEEFIKSLSQNIEAIDQCILLGFCLNIKNTNPMNGMTKEEMLPFVTRILENPNNWLVYSMALLIRSRLEKDKSRTVERAALQVQALVDQFDQDKTVSYEERGLYFFELLYPAFYEMKKELAERFMSIGVIKSSLEIFTALEMIEEQITCYQMLEQTKKATDLVLAELEKNPKSSKMWCILGDITNDEKNYEKAWEVSNFRFARAQRSLGYFHFKRRNYEESINCFRKALQLNSMFENCWFVMGCAALQIEDWETGKEAFTRTVILNSENGEAWSNLSAIHQRTENLRDSYNCLKEALKHSFDNWKIWDNYLSLSLKLNELNDAVLAFNRILDLKDKLVDVQLLKVYITLLQGQLDSNGNELGVKKLIESTRLLLGRITSKITSNPDIWDVCAFFYESIKDFDKFVDCRMKSFRHLQAKSQIQNASDFQAMAKAAHQVSLDILAHRNDRSSIFQCQTIIKNFLHRTRDDFSDNDLYLQLESSLNTVNNLL